MSLHSFNALNNALTALNTSEILARLEEEKLDRELNSRSVVEYGEQVKTLVEQLCIRLQDTKKYAKSISGVLKSVEQINVNRLQEQLIPLDEEIRSLFGIWMIGKSLHQESLEVNDQGSPHYFHTLMNMMHVFSIVKGYPGLPIPNQTDTLNDTGKIWNALDAIDGCANVSQYFLKLGADNGTGGSNTKHFNALSKTGFGDPIRLASPLVDPILGCKFYSSDSYMLLLLYAQAIQPIAFIGDLDNQYELIIREMDCFGEQFRKSIASIDSVQINDFLLKELLNSQGNLIDEEGISLLLYPEKHKEAAFRKSVENSIIEAANKGLISRNPLFISKAIVESRPSLLPGKLTVLVDGKKVAVVPFLSNE